MENTGYKLYLLTCSIRPNTELNTSVSFSAFLLSVISVVLKHVKDWKRNKSLNTDIFSPDFTITIYYFAKNA